MRRIGVASLLLRTWRHGQRNACALRAAGAFLDHGWTEDMVRQMLKIVSTIAGDDARYTANA